MNAQRMVFVSVAVLVITGMWLTGFDKVHWIMYIPVVLLSFAGISGICVGEIFWSKLGFKDKPMSCNLPSNS